jgi:hypothetical protein
LILVIFLHNFFHFSTSVRAAPAQLLQMAFSGIHHPLHPHAFGCYTYALNAIIY